MRRHLADTKTRTSLEQPIIAESSIAQHKLTLLGHEHELRPLSSTWHWQYRHRQRGGDGHVVA